MTGAPIPLRVDDIERSDELLVHEALASGRLHNGSIASRLELLAAKTCGCAHGVAMSSPAAATGLIASWMLGELSGAPSDVAAEIIVSPFTSPNLLAPFGAAGFRIIPVDVDPKSLTLEPRLVEKRINDRTKAILFCHTFGNPGNIAAVAKIAAAHEVPLIEDATCTLGTTHAGRPGGAWGRVSIVGLGRESPISAGGGAIVVTDDSALAEDLHARRRGVASTGFRGAFSGQGLTELQAAVALGRLERLPRARDRRGALADRFVRGLLRVRDTIVPTTDEKTVMYWSDFHVRLETTYTEEERDRIIGAMRAHDVLVEPPAALVLPGDAEHRAPIANSVSQRIIRLPFHAKLTSRDVDLVVQTLEVVLARENLSRG